MSCGFCGMQLVQHYHSQLTCNDFNVNKSIAFESRQNRLMWCSTSSERDTATVYTSNRDGVLKGITEGFVVE
ncbi:hypothetical protein PISMIDRAFT_684312 [Pisolithus microcarpus 441]|uniref:Uncharacterized protein n=1 Tax=Pisolithus microcarpus 441 TaxID=765257 RepID=A0A0C9YWD5_9AGAM|nr:hypothetical protein PISMIDRAFT_684312 [Pisolithus microcarpus 441]